MKTKKKTIDVYICEICGTEYPDNEAAAKKCEARKVESKTFSYGEKVIANEVRTDEQERLYHLVGYIVKILVEPPDVEYIRKWLGNQGRLKWHNLVYLVNIDPKAKDGHRYYAPELDYTNQEAGKLYI